MSGPLWKKWTPSWEIIQRELITLENSPRICEHYDSVTGKPLGVTFLGMSCSTATMMFDGLCRDYTGVSVRRKN